MALVIAEMRGNGLLGSASRILAGKSLSRRREWVAYLAES